MVELRAREVFDFRCNPTGNDYFCAGGCFVRASVPSGASTGVCEAHEMRDEDKGQLFGKVLMEAVVNVNCTNGPTLVGFNVTLDIDMDKLVVEELNETMNEWSWWKPRLGCRHMC